MRRLLTHRTFIKAMTFGAVGILNACVDFAFFSLCIRAFVMPLIASNILAWFIAASCSYVMNTLITFRAETGRVLRSQDYIKFLASGVIGMTAATATLVILAGYMPVLAAKFFAIFVTFAANFSMSHFVVFRKREVPNIDSKAMDRT